MPQKNKVFGFVGTDHIRTKIIINVETLEQVSQFTYLGCSISYQFSNDVEFKLATFLQLIDTIKRTIFVGKWERKLFWKYTTLHLYDWLTVHHLWILCFFSNLIHFFIFLTYFYNFLLTIFSTCFGPAGPSSGESNYTCSLWPLSLVLCYFVRGRWC